MKRGQITISIALGLVILIILSFFLYNNIAKKNKNIQQEKDEILAFNDAKVKVKEYTEQCLKSVTEQAMENLWVVDSDTLFVYINGHLVECIDEYNSIEEEGYEIEYGKYTPSIELTNDYMYVSLDFPVEISKFEQKGRIDSFVYKQLGDYSAIVGSSDDIIVGPTFDPINDTTPINPGKHTGSINLKNELPEGFEPIFQNIGLKVEELTEPRPIRAYIVKVNVNDPNVGFFVTPPGEAYQSTEYFRQKNNLQVAINGDGHIVGGTVSDHATGFGASEGVEYFDFAPEHPTMYFSKDNEVQFFDKPKEIWNAISGFRTLVKKGKLNGKLTAGHPDYKEYYETQIRARTSMGYDEENNILIIIIVIEGGEYFGMSIRELGELFLEHGATSAIDMDSGSSSSLALEGKGVIAGGHRLVANHFGVYGEYSIETVT